MVVNVGSARAINLSQSTRFYVSISLAVKN